MARRVGARTLRPPDCVRCSTAEGGEGEYEAAARPVAGDHVAAAGARKPPGEREPEACAASPVSGPRTPGSKTRSPSEGSRPGPSSRTRARPARRAAGELERHARARVAAGVVDERGERAPHDIGLALARGQVLRRGRRATSGNSRASAARSTAPDPGSSSCRASARSVVDRPPRAGPAWARSRAAPAVSLGAGLRRRERELRAPAQPGERRAQLVRHLAGKALLVAARACDAREQVVERRRQSRELVARQGPRSKRRSRSCAPQSSASAVICATGRSAPSSALRIASRPRAGPGRRRRASRAAPPARGARAAHRQRDDDRAARRAAPRRPPAARAGGCRRVPRAPWSAARARAPTATRSRPGRTPAGRSITRLPSSTHACRSRSLSFCVSRTRTWPGVTLSAATCASARARSRLVASVVRRAIAAARCPRRAARRARRRGSRATSAAAERGSSSQPVADAARGLDRLGRAGLPQLAADPRDVGVERVVVHDRAVGPAGCDERSAPDDRARAGRERREEAELGRRQRDPRASPNVACAAGSSTSAGRRARTARCAPRGARARGRARVTRRAQTAS